MIFFLLFLLCLFICLIDMWAYQSLRTDEPTDLPEDLPVLSIIIAARNEERTITNCLESLLEQNYPQDKLDIIVVNDQSEDATAAIVERFVQEYPFIRLIDAGPLNKGLNGKANALVQGVNVAKADYYLFTDADVVLPKSWVSAMFAALKPGKGIVTGITLIRARYLFGLFQSFDWSIALSYIQILGGKRIPVTAMGNNMLVSKEAYNKAGGFENTKGTLTEDYALFRNIVKAGFGYRTFFHHSVLAFTRPMPTFGALLNQRKRWMKGIQELPFKVMLLLILQGIFFPLLLAILFYSKLMAFALMGLRMTIQAMLLLKAHDILKLRPRFFLYFLYQVYNMILTISLILYYFVPWKIRWKGRKY
jgi:cellulose synthase/poly-beta-1,6-N-acetylglucosamine synthase-like glycosyltransferase